MLKVILFGDSIFAGYHQGQTESIVKDNLKAALPKLEITNAAIPGATTTTALDWQQALVTSQSYDLVVMMFGANDVSQTSGICPAHYYEQLTQLVQFIGRDKIILVTAPFSDEQILQDRTQKQIQAYCQTTLQLGKELSIPVIDLYSAMRAQKNPKELLQSDGIHFTKSAYQLLNQLLVKAITQWAKTYPSV